MTLIRSAIVAAAALAWTTPALAQRAQESAVAAATDGFGATVGNERVGVYTTSNVRGFSPITAGNRRLEGLYFDLGGNGLSNRLVARSTVRVGLPALVYPFPAPSGIVDYGLRTPTGDAVLSIVAAVPVYGGYQLEIDGRTPLGNGVALAGGLGLASNTYADGRSTEARSLAVIPSLQLGPATVTAFAGLSYTGGDVPAIMVTSGPFTPPIVDPGDFLGQPWIDNKQVSETVGLLASTSVTTGLDLRVVAIQSNSTRERTYTNLFTGVQPDGSAQEIVVSDPRLPARWTSGEAQLSWRLTDGASTHRFIAALKARDKRLEAGGSASVNLGRATIGLLTERPEPVFRYSAPSVNEVTQTSAGLAYIGHLEGGWDLNLGVQRTAYRTRFTTPARVDEKTASPWLYNVTAAWAPTVGLGFYGGVSRGLEESAPAPSSAANRDNAIPASETRQIDAGVRVVLGELRLVVGAFQLERPYYSVGEGNIYEPLGDIRNRGVEISLAGAVTPRLSLIAGLVLSDPRVIGESVDSGRAGPRPVGSSIRLARIDAEYRLPMNALSVTAAVQYSGPVIASTRSFESLGDRQLEIADSAILDLGLRHRLTVDGTPVSLRAQILNVFDTRRLGVASGNAFTTSDTRRFTLQITADF